MYMYRYLLNGNVLASRAFLAGFISHISPSGQPLPLGTTGDEILLTEDSLLNFAQLAVRSVQRAAGAQNRITREAWIRLCGTYQSHGGVLAHPEICLVCDKLVDPHKGLDAVSQVLNELATLYFEIPPPRTANVNPFGDVMSSLFGGSPSPGSGPAAQPRTITPGGSRAHLTLD